MAPDPHRFHLLQNLPGRHATSLDGSWHIIVDPYDNGYYDYRYQPAADHYGLNRKSRGSHDRVEYDFDKSPTLAVPGDWNSQIPELALYEGSVWYQRDFNVEPQPGRRYFLRFGAANYEARVYVNGTLVRHHVGGFTEFEAEIGEQLLHGENTVVVQVNDSRRRDGVPTVNTDWFNFGGLTRSVHLVETPETYLQDYFVQLQPGSSQTLMGWVQVSGSGQAGALVELSIAKLGVQLELQTDEDGYVSFELCPHCVAESFQLWSPANPQLYDVTLRLQAIRCPAGSASVVTNRGASAPSGDEPQPGDVLTDRIGFRSIETRGADILLNGEPIFLRGISIHEQAPERPGRAYSEADARKLLGWAKELGANYVRLAHYPHNEHMVRVAEELGLLVWAEVPVYWTILWDNPSTYDNARQQVVEMVSRDKNRAAVILWSVANETPISDSRNRFLTGLIDTVREMDPTRLLTAALENHYTDATTVVLDDPLGERLDVLGCNQYVGWYDGMPEKADTLSWKVAYDKPLLFSELGAGAKAGLHGSAEERWTEEFQARVYEHQIQMLRRIPQWRGMTPWILSDFQSPRRPLPGIQDGWNRKGLVSDRGEKKLAFDVLQSFYERVAQDPGASQA